MKKPSLCLFWEWLSHGAQSKIFLWAGVGGWGGGYTAVTKDLRILVAYKSSLFPTGGIYYR